MVFNVLFVRSQLIKHSLKQQFNSVYTFNKHGVFQDETL